jgi:xylulokinase
MNDLAAQSPAGANSLLFLPYLAGERSPRWNPAAKAAFIGLTLRHTRADMFRAVMEGVALNLTVILKAFQAQGSTVEAVRVIGGGSTSRVWMQIMADCFGVPIQRLQVLEEATSMGAAVVGGVGIGMYPDFGIADQMNSIADSLAPNMANRETYARHYHAFEDSYRALVPIYDMLDS